MIAGVESLKFVLMVFFLAMALFFYETVRYGLTVEMGKKGRWTSTNVRALVLGCTIGAGAFVFAVGLAQSIWLAWGGR